MTLVQRFQPLISMMIKEFVQMFRDKKMNRMLIIAPIMQILIFGYVVTTDVKHIPTAIYDLDNSASSRELIAQFLRSNYFDAVKYIQTNKGAVGLIDHGAAQMVIRINHGFESILKKGLPAHVQLILDGTDSNSTSIGLGYASEIVSRYNQQLQTQQVSAKFGRPPQTGGVVLQTRTWYNENLESRNFYMPGVVALILMMSTMTMASMAIVREKEIGTMEQMIVTPISKLEFILGKLVPFSLVGLFNAVIVFVVALLWFQVPFRGSLLMLLIGVVLFLICMLGVGLLISTISQTQQQAMMTGFFFNNPFMLLSGFVFPISNMPRVIQWLTYLNPLRYILIIVRGVFLKGTGLSVLWPQLLGLAVLSMSIITLAIKRFQKTL